VPRIVGYSRAAADTIEALKRGAITEPADTPAGAARDADLVVLAAPPEATSALLGRIGPWLAPTAVVTDVASVKVPVVAAAVANGLADRFAGSHPLAGTHATGFGAATATMLRGVVVYVTDTGTAAGDQAARAVASFWRRVAGAETVRIDAAAHDEQLAWTSHLPQAVASILGATMAARGLGGVSFGTGARDTMRLAASDPDLWVEILLANAGPVADALAAAGRELEALRAALVAGDGPAVHSLLQQGATFRRGLDR
jgi:prephenate dehydrogenase